MQTLDEIAATLRNMVNHESEQVHRRLSWLGTFQGFLFAALGFAWGKRKGIFLVISFLGLAIAVLVLLGLLAATFAIARIRQYWLAHRAGDYDGPDIWGFYPERASWSAYTSPENLIPLAFAGAWLAVLSFI